MLCAGAGPTTGTPVARNRLTRWGILREHSDLVQLRKGLPAGAALGSALGVQCAALPAAVIHLPGKEPGQNGAEAQDSQKHRNVDQYVSHAIWATSAEHGGSIPDRLLQSGVPGRALRNE